MLPKEDNRFLEVVGNPTTLTGHRLQAEGTFLWRGTKKVKSVLKAPFGGLENEGGPS